MPERTVANKGRPRSAAPTKCSCYDKRNVADVIIDIDRPLFTYTFTYKITDRSSGIVLAIGKVTAFDGNLAAPKLAERVIEDMKVARGESKAKK